MNRREFISLTAKITSAAALGGCCRSLGNGNSSKVNLPNIIVVLADDLGYGDPQCYNDQSKIPTRNIDKLGSEGVRFTDAHTPSAVCTPTRYGLLTGRYCWRTSLKQSVLWPWDKPLIEADRLTMPKMLKEHGYKTACIGKWHLGWDWPTVDGSKINDEIDIGKYNEKMRTEFGYNKIDFSKSIAGGPLTRDFDYYFGDDVPNFPPYCFIENDRVLSFPTEHKPKEMFGHDGPAQDQWRLDEVMPKITDKAAEYIKKRASKNGQPFFLYFTLTAPHTPIAPDEEYIGKSDAGRYGDYVHQVDASLGQIINTLKQYGIEENTLLIFTSDNGSPQRDGTNMSGPTGSVKKRFGHDPSRPWRGMKGDIWEAGHRVPFIARWPGKIKPGTISNETICLTDLMATFADITGHKLDGNSAEDSFNILPVLLGKQYLKPIRPDIIHHSGNGVFAIRKDGWKLIQGKGSGGFTRYKPPQDSPPGQLYNLRKDPSEQENLYLKYPEIVEKLTLLLEEYKRTGRSNKIAAGTIF